MAIEFQKINEKEIREVLEKIITKEKKKKKELEMTSGHSRN